MTRVIEMGRMPWPWWHYPDDDYHSSFDAENVDACCKFPPPIVIHIAEAVFDFVVAGAVQPIFVDDVAFANFAHHLSDVDVPLVGHCHQCWWGR